MKARRAAERNILYHLEAFKRVIENGKHLLGWGGVQQLEFMM